MKNMIGKNFDVKQLVSHLDAFDSWTLGFCFIARDDILEVRSNYPFGFIKSIKKAFSEEFKEDKELRRMMDYKKMWKTLKAVAVRDAAKGVLDEMNRLEKGDITKGFRYVSLLHYNAVECNNCKHNFKVPDVAGWESDLTCSKCGNKKECKYEAAYASRS